MTLSAVLLTCLQCLWLSTQGSGRSGYPSMSRSAPHVWPLPAQPTLHCNTHRHRQHRLPRQRQLSQGELRVLTLQATSPFLSRVQWPLTSQGLKVSAAHDCLGRQPDVWLPRKPGLHPPHLYEPWEERE